MDRSTEPAKRGRNGWQLERMFSAGLPTVCPLVLNCAPMSGMRRLKRAMLVIATGEILTAVTTAMAQSPSGGPPAASAVTVSLSGDSRSDTSSGPDSNTKSASATTDNASPKQSAGGSGAGYTWRDKPSRGKHRKLHSTKVNPNLTQAKGPEFALGSDGTSRITVQLSRKVEVLARGSHRRYVYDLPDVQVAIANDMNPLITTHFATPLQDARLITQKQGARLVIDLRENVAPQYSMKDTTGGGTILEVVLPKSLRMTSVATNAKPSKVRANSKMTRKRHSPKDKSAVPQNGIGPRL